MFAFTWDTSGKKSRTTRRDQSLLLQNRVLAIDLSVDDNDTTIDKTGAEAANTKYDGDRLVTSRLKYFGAKGESASA